MSYAVTPERLIIRRGIFMSIDEVELYRSGCADRFRLINQIAGIGSVSIASSDETTRGGDLVLREIGNAGAARDFLRRLVDAARRLRGVRELGHGPRGGLRATKMGRVPAGHAVHARAGHRRRRRFLRDDPDSAAGYRELGYAYVERELRLSPASEPGIGRCAARQPALRLLCRRRRRGRRPCRIEAEARHPAAQGRAGPPTSLTASAELLVLAPDGNLIAFGAPIGPKPPTPGTGIDVGKRQLFVQRRQICVGQQLQEVGEAVDDEIALLEGARAVAGAQHFWQREAARRRGSSLSSAKWLSPKLDSRPAPDAGFAFSRASPNSTLYQ